MSSCPPCTMEYSRGGGTGVAEALGNWGFSSEVVSPGHELERMACLLERMERLREQPKCAASTTARKRSCPRQVCLYKHSPPECRPAWMFPKNSPLITYSSVDTTLLTSNNKIVAVDARNPIPERGYASHGTDKWYKLGSPCCPQPSCPLPYCSRIVKVQCCQYYCP